MTESPRAARDRIRWEGLAMGMLADRLLWSDMPDKAVYWLAGVILLVCFAIYMIAGEKAP